MNDKDKDEWGNIELPGFGDDLLLSPNLNYILANREKAKDPQWRAKNKASREKLAQDPEWIIRQKAGSERNSRDPEYRTKHKIAMQECRSKNKDSYESQKKKIQGTNKKTGEVRVWDSLNDAALELIHSPGNISEAASGKRKSAAGYTWKYL